MVSFFILQAIAEKASPGGGGAADDSATDDVETGSVQIRGPLGNTLRINLISCLDACDVQLNIEYPSIQLQV